MPEYQNNPEGPDGPWIRVAVYIFFTIAGAIVGGIAAVLLLNRDSWRHHYSTYHTYPYEYLVEFILGAILGAVTGFTTVRKVCRDIDSEK